MYYLIINNEIAAQGKDFDELVEMADSEMEGFVVEAKDWDNR